MACQCLRQGVGRQRLLGPPLLFWTPQAESLDSEGTGMRLASQAERLRGPGSSSNVQSSHIGDGQYQGAAAAGMREGGLRKRVRDEEGGRGQGGGGEAGKKGGGGRRDGRPGRSHLAGVMNGLHKLSCPLHYKLPLSPILSPLPPSLCQQFCRPRANGLNNLHSWTSPFARRADSLHKARENLSR